MDSAPHVAGCLITNDIQQVLLLRQPDGTWHLPSAPALAGEEPQHTAHRAAREVAGLTGTIAAELGQIPADTINGTPAHHIYGFAPSTDPMPILALESFGWFHSDNLPGVTATTAAFIRTHAPARRQLPRAQWLATTARSWACAAAIITSPDGRLLLVRSPDTTWWHFVGGMIDAHETGPEGAAREVREETGLDLPAGRLLAVSWQHPEPGLDHTILQFFHDFGTIDPDTVTLRCDDGEIVGWHWFSPHEFDAATGPGRAHLARQALAARHGTDTIVITSRGLSAHSTTPSP